MMTGSKIAISVLITIIATFVALTAYWFYIIRSLYKLGLDFSDEELDFPDFII